MSKPFLSPRSRNSRAAFTILELLVSIAIFSAILVSVMSAVNQISAMWRSTSDKIEAFQDARAAFDLLTRNLSQATLNTYVGYDDDVAPKRYLRKSELQLICKPAGTDFPGTVGTGEAVFFQAPASRTKNTTAYGGMEGLLNGCGYYIEYDPYRNDSDDPDTPDFIQAKAGHQRLHRYRLMQLLIPTEENKIYSTPTQWYEGHSLDAHVIASNIIALIIRPQDPAATTTEVVGVDPPDLTGDYSYDSTADGNQSPQPITANQLPPVIQVTMIAITESSAIRLGNSSTPPNTITNALAGRFSNTAHYADDLEAVEKALSSAVPRIDYRVFSSAVPIRESRWSK